MVEEMTFIQPDEFIILVPDHNLTDDDLKRINETGVRTAFGAIMWEEIETKAGYNWDKLDEQIDRVKQAGMKSLLRCHDNAPDWFPDDWYLRSATGAIWRNHYGFGGNDRFTCLSPWCKDAMKRQHSFMRACNDRYHDEWVQVFAGGPHGGEVILPGMVPCYWDPHAIKSYREFTGDTGNPADLPNYGSMKFETKTVEWLRHSLTEAVTIEQDIFPEIWLQLVERDTSFAESFECGPRSGNWLMSDLCANLPKSLQKDLNVLLWEVNRPGGNQGALNNVKDVLHKTWIGSQYCEGLYHYTKDSIDKGLRGFITNPAAFYAHNGSYTSGKLEDWMLDAFRWSIAQWKRARL
jgi:hypothetical protein